MSILAYAGYFVAFLLFTRFVCWIMSNKVHHWISATILLTLVVIAPIAAVIHNLAANPSPERLFIAAAIILGFVAGIVWTVRNGDLGWEEDRKYT